MRYLFLLLLMVVQPAWAASDYDREKKWADEIVPGVVIGDPVYLEAQGHKFLGLYTVAPNAKAGLVIVHGIGVHPDHGIVGNLRMALADRGFATLSAQMPILAADAPPQQYTALMPLAAERIAAAATWLQQRGHGDLVLVSHSMGSRMAGAYFDAAGTPAFRAWVALGLGDEFGAGFSRRRPVPVLDVMGDTDLPAVLRNAPARRRVAESTAGRQVTIAGADHFYAGREAELVAAIAGFAAR